MSEEEGAPAPEIEKTVPLEKFQRVAVAKQGLEQQIADLKAAHAEKLEQLQSQVSDWQSKAEQASGRFDRYQAISEKIGTGNPEAIEAVEWQYGKLEGDDKPDLGAWLDGMREDPEKVPLVLRPIFAPAEPEAPKAPRQRKVDAKPPEAGKVDVNADVARLRRHAEQTGDWSAYREWRKANGIG